MRRLFLLLALLAVSSPALAQSPLAIVPVKVTVTSGQESVVLRTDARGQLTISAEGRTVDVGRIAPDGSFTAQTDGQTLALDEQGYFVHNDDTSPIRLDDNATVSIDSLDVFRVQTSNLVEIEPIEHALPRAISSVRIEVSPGGDRLAAYLIAIYLLMM